MKIKKDDTVQILLGKDQSKTGKVLRVLPKKGQVLVEGVNAFKRHIKKMGQREGGVMEIFKPINTSNVALVCPNCKKTARIGYEIKGSVKVRICKKCREVIK